ncbi:MAG: phytanoyl-CoA dioxygenase family protein [Nocardioides sp.]
MSPVSGALIPTEASLDAEALRAELVKQGYLYFPGLLADRVGDAARDIADVLMNCGVAADVQLIATAECPDHFDRTCIERIYPGLQRQESCHALGSDHRLVGIASMILGHEVFNHPSRVIRLGFPNKDAAFSTKPHQDYSINSSEPDVLTTWISLNGAHEHMRGLQLVPGSHLAGPRQVDPEAGGRRALYLLNDGLEWATAGYEPGDVVLFHAWTVHCGGGNTSNRIRVSLDFRYQSTSAPIPEFLVQPHGYPRTPGWPELTRGWKSPVANAVPASMILKEPRPNTMSTLLGRRA